MPQGGTRSLNHHLDLARARMPGRLALVSQVLPQAQAAYRLNVGMPARLGSLALLLLLEKGLLNLFVDFDRAQAAAGLGAALRVVQHWGLRFVVALFAAIVLFAAVRGGAALAAAAARICAAPLRLRWALLHVLAFLPLIPLSGMLFPAGAPPLPLVAVAALWLLCASAALLAALAALAPLRLWLLAAHALGNLWAFALVAAGAGAAAMQWSQQLWAPTAGLTFELVARLLRPLLPQLSADPLTRVLGTDRFAVQISEVCSGLEGVGLMLAFCCTWLLYFRREYLFPRALLLIPAALIVIFALNVLRVAALMLIGAAGFPGVAAYGFHSQAGWIAFNAVACALVYLSRRSTWLNRSALVREHSGTENPTAIYLLPFLAILAAGSVARAASAQFEYLYPLRLLAGALALAWYRKPLRALNWRWSWRAPAVGVLVFVLWIGAAHWLVPAAGVPPGLMALPAPWRGLWLGCRVAAAVMTVPIAEELAYRGYFMRRLVSPEFETVPFGAVPALALLASAVVFGIAHGAFWLPGIAAGLAFGALLRSRACIGEAVVAHATTNALLALWVLGKGQWQVW
jgi:exosortase E/protease (VPEID-CTERM system)